MREPGSILTKCDTNTLISQYPTGLPIYYSFPDKYSYTQCVGSLYYLWFDLGWVARLPG